VHGAKLPVMQAGRLHHKRTQPSSKNTATAAAKSHKARKNAAAPFERRAKKLTAPALVALKVRASRLPAGDVAAGHGVTPPKSIEGNFRDTIAHLAPWPCILPFLPIVLTTAPTNKNGGERGIRTPGALAESALLKNTAKPLGWG